MDVRSRASLRRVVACGVAALAPFSSSAQTTCPPGSRRPPYEPRGGIVVEFGPPEVGEVVLKGIVKTSKGYTAMLEDCRFGKSLSVQVGHQLADGRVSALDADGITFEIAGTASAKAKTKRLTLKAKE